MRLTRFRAAAIRGTFALLILAGDVLYAPSAQAQGAPPSRPHPEAIREKKTDAGYEVWFPIDQLGADPLGEGSLTVRDHLGAARMGLLRPRVAFVNELLKSVENL